MISREEQPLFSKQLVFSPASPGRSDVCTAPYLALMGGIVIMTDSSKRKDKKTSTDDGQFYR